MRFPLSLKVSSMMAEPSIPRESSGIRMVSFGSKGSTKNADLQEVRSTAETEVCGGTEDYVLPLSMIRGTDMCPMIIGENHGPIFPEMVCFTTKMVKIRNR